jgi:hypothetical protein
MASRGTIGKSSVKTLWRKLLLFFNRANVFAALSLLFAAATFAQAVPYARTYQKSKEEVDGALKELQAYAGEKLPIVDGFVAIGNTPLDRYERAFYQFSIDLLPGTSGGTVVRLTAKITAWYADRDPAKSGYQVLPSNGRLELDLLDRLDEKFGGKLPVASSRPLSNSTISAPRPKLDLTGVPGVGGSGAANPTPSSQPRNDELAALRVQREAEEKRMRELNAELQGLQEIQKDQAHPLNLVVVKRSGTPVLARPADGSRVLFNAAADDEFEFLDAEGEWIHVEISGASRGYIRQNSLELPEFIAARLKSPNGTAGEEKPAPFRIEHEENSIFPGDWESLKGRVVKIYTVQPASQDPKETGARAKLAYTGSLFRKFAAEASPSTPPAQGVVVIFDSADGGIVGATLASVKQFAGNEITPEAFWKQCYLDPPDALQESRKP